MKLALRLKLAWVIAVMAAGCLHSAAQAPGVPICTQARQESQYQTNLLITARGFFTNGPALKLAEVRKQFKRTSCELTLPEAGTRKLAGRDICIAARRSHVRVGWCYLCDKCSKWHLSLAGGYAVAANGAVATCFHVVEPASNMREGCLVALDEAGTILPVTEVLAGNRESDACIVRVPGDNLKPLPLNVNVFPGDTAYCYSDPVERRDYFSAGIVNRFYQTIGPRPAAARSAGAPLPLRINVSTDWAPGSSGSAVLDDCGNVIGHVSTISAVNNKKDSGTEIVFHDAVSARDVLLLVRSRKD
jgi:hypothetical protein